MRLIILAGANSIIGQSYCYRFFSLENTKTIQISRSIDKLEKEVERVQLDLLDKKETARFVSSIPLENVTQIYYLHLAGKFKFEEKKEHTRYLDMDVFNTNYTTFINAYHALSTSTMEKRVKGDVHLHLYGFGSVSDEFEVPYWKSYTQTKNLLRRFIEVACINEKNFSGAFFSMSSVNTPKERKLRPNADRRFWLSSSEVVDYTWRKILEHEKGFNDYRIIKSNPNYDYTFFKPKKVYTRWMKEMGKH